ncbi:hypothetical protein MesoLj131b_32490 [Mesorhizobium sp. 131-2-5]|uniref:hypothetical protein n=1 Tax=Mesorhizobium sp. 131-2-5 TaxID=2744519 RepID=UPI00192802BA|nr:hypothetical protein [Mesorhizobium sp. 131-2-5]BCH01250.1 hypothetical protein MesoLj131b_32490 [Mesorhizobium sp. 131-2-5]
MGKASRQFHKVGPTVWRSRRFLALTNDQRLLWFYFSTGPHQTSAGCCMVPPAYAVADLGWTREHYESCLDALSVADLISHDEETNEIYVCRWFQTSPPTNAKHAAGIASNIYKLDSRKVSEKAEAEFLETEWGAQFVGNPSIASR